MTRRRGFNLLSLVALPVVCCGGHALAIAIGAGSFAAVTGAGASSFVIAMAGTLLAVTVLTVAWKRRRKRA